MPGETLRLHAHDVAWGRFESLEAFLVAEHIPFARCADGYPGSWCAEAYFAAADFAVPPLVVGG